MAASSGKGVNIAIGATLSNSLGSAVRGAQTQMGKLGSVMSTIGKQKAGVDQMQKLSLDVDSLGRSFNAAEAKANALRASFTAMGPPTAELVPKIRTGMLACPSGGKNDVCKKETFCRFQSEGGFGGVDQ